MADMENRIKEIRKDRGLSQEQLADAVHTTKATISKLEKGDIQLTMEWMRKLARALECHWAELGEDAAPPPKDEQAMLGLYRGLSDQQKKFAHKLVSTLAEPDHDLQDGDDTTEDHKSTRNKNTG